MAIKPVSGEIKSQDINDNLSYLDNKLSQVNGGPLGSLGSVAELNQKYPKGANGFFIIDGHMYFWENDKWIDKGVYQAKDIADGSISYDKIESKTKKSIVSMRDFNNVSFTEGYYVNYTTGRLNKAQEFSYSSFIELPIENERLLLINHDQKNRDTGLRGIAFYTRDNENGFISGIQYPKYTNEVYQEIEIPKNTKFMRFTAFNEKIDICSLLFADKSEVIKNIRKDLSSNTETLNKLDDNLEYASTQFKNINLTEGEYLNYTHGGTSSGPDFGFTNFIKVIPNTKLILKDYDDIRDVGLRGLAFYKEATELSFVKGVQYPLFSANEKMDLILEVPENGNYLRFTVYLPKKDMFKLYPFDILEMISSGVGSSEINEEQLKEIEDKINSNKLSIEDIERKNNNITTTVIENKEKIKSVQEQVNNAILESGESNLEVVQARVDNKGQTSVNLHERLVKIDDKLNINEQLNNFNLDDVFEPPIQKDINEHFSGGDAFARGDTKLFNEFNALFSDLIVGNEGYITQFDLGVDNSNWRHFYYYVFEPKKYTKTVILGSGTHGGEKVAVVTLAKFLDLVVNHWRKYPQLAYIRHNVRLVVTPIQNPFGVFRTTRNNENEVDINRNFDYNWEQSNDAKKGSAPFSEFSSKCIKQVLDKYSDAVAYVDNHNMSAGDRPYSESSYIPSKLAFPTKGFREVMFNINQSRKYEDIELGGFDQPTTFNYANFKYGITSLNPEYVPGVFSPKYDSDDMTHAMRFYANIFIYFCLHGEKSYTFKSESFIEHQSKKVDNLVLTENASVISSLSNFNFVPLTNGFLKVTYSVTLSSATNETTLFPILTQTKNTILDGYSNSNEDSWFIEKFASYHKGMDKTTLTIVAVMPVSVSQLKVDVFLKGIGKGTKVENISRTIEFISSENK